MSTSLIDLPVLIKQVRDLTPLPPTTVRLAELAGNPKSDLEDAAEVIMYDQALTLKLLRAANSAAYGTVVPAACVLDALIRLGSAQVLALAVASNVKSSLQTKVPAYDLGEGALWRHSVAAAAAAETVQLYGKVPAPPGTFAAALLHDIGKLVMGRFLDAEIISYIRRAQEAEKLDRSGAESLLLEVHHGELGGLIAQNWKLPPRIVQGITYHHNPDEGMDVICDLTYLADQFAKFIEAGLDGQEPKLTILPSVAERLQLTPKTAAELCATATERYEKVSQRYNSV